MTDDAPPCAVSGEPSDECDHLAAYEYDEVEAADERLHIEREERD